jgi:hypothetical protein
MSYIVSKTSTMGTKYDSIENINKKKEIWRLAVIVDDMWSVYKGDKETSLELIIRDLKVHYSH